MSQVMKKGKTSKAIAAGLLSLAMALQPVSAFDLGPAEVKAADWQAPTDMEIAANDNILYVANCGTPDAAVTPSGVKLGLYQSNVDQEYAADTGTGLSWGYMPNDEYSVRATNGGDASSLTGSCVYMSDKNVTYEAGKSGFAYSFELPDLADNTYAVTVGIKNPWGQYGAKKEDILIEGTTVETALSAGTSLFEKEYEVKVTDGELNVFVQANPDNRKGTGDDPILSYIIVKAANVTANELEVLQLVINDYKAKVEGKQYTEKTTEAFNQAIADAQELVDNKSTDAGAIEAAKTAMADAYAALVELVFETYTSFTGTNGARMYATNGEKIQAHGGQIQKIGDTYYWIGEDRTNEYRPMPGVHLYTSKDLYNWTDEGVVLRTMENYEQFETDEYFKSLYGSLTDAEKKDIYVDLWAEGCVMERPKMLYNEKTGKYVIWFHADGTSPYSEDTGSNYAKAKAGIAIADNPAGPYKLLGSYMLCSDPTDDHNNHGFDSVGGHVRDMNLFKDDDGTAYIMYSSEGNAVMYVARLNDSYTGLAKDADEMVLGEDFGISSTDSREGPAMFKYQDKYYMITSGCTGWAPNQAAYAVADSPIGPWIRMGDPCVGDTNHNTFSTQSTCVIPVDADNGEFIYMGDRWYNPDNGAKLSDSRYVWLPIEFGSGNTIMIKNYSDWTLDELKGKGAISIDTKLPETAESVSALKAALPETIDVTIGGQKTTGAAVTWEVEANEALGDCVLGDVSVVGTLTDLNRQFTISVFCCPKQLVYFADCYTNGDNTSEVFEKFAANADDLVNTVSDQPYGEDKGVTWGYTSTPGASGGSSSEDMGSKGSGDFYDTGWWATSNGNIEYGFEVEPGNYVVSTGFQEWWSSTRGIKITVSSVAADGTKTELGTGSASLSSSKTRDQSNVTVTVPEDSDHILVTISKASGSDPVLSWIGITSTDEPEPQPAENLVVNGSFENGKDGWSADDATVVEDENAPEGTHYLRDNGSAYSWGAGSSQSVTVSPDTEYVLTGTAKVDSGVYWVGAKVDGREIYSVFSSAADYTDTTNTDAKLAYQVCAGATEWTDFEIRFTTGPDTTSVNVYTWADPKVTGCLDNVVLTEVTGSLDWTAFDTAMEDVKALNKADWTEESWTEFQKVVKEAEDFKANANDETKQRDIRLMTAKVQAAMGELISIHEPTGEGIYYVDAENGDDSNDGLSPETAWKTLTKASSIRKLKAGSGILLKAGCVWNGEQLSVNGAEGTEDDPVIIGSYGDGAMPVINGNGANWSAGRKEELAAVHICNSNNIIVEGLEITNWDSSVGEIGSYAQSGKLLSGLVIENRDAGELYNNIVLDNKIHDVNGRMAGGSEKAAGGLIVVVTGNGKNHTGEVESWFNGLLINGNEVYNVCHEAIYMESVWAARKLVGGSSSDTGYQNAGNGKWTGSSDVDISNNYVHDVAGDGIVPINTTECLVEYNLIDNSADSNWNYSANPNHAALWTWDTDNVTFRYNEACNTSKASKGTAVGNDSMAFDFDYGVQNCLYEYNYSHDNLGGFLMLCPGPGATVNNIARYNLSINDGLYDGAPMIRVGGGKYGSNGVQIYNNTMYWAGTGYSAALAPTSNWEGSVVTDVSIFNNIFYGPAKADSVKTDGVTYSNNLVWGGAEDVYTAAVTDDTTVVADPMFVDVTDYTTGNWEDGTVILGTADGFKLQAGSPAIDAGADHPEAPNSTPSTVADELVENTTEKPEYDYYGTKLADGKNDIGANEYVEKVTVDRTELEKAIKDAKAVDADKYTADSYGVLRLTIEYAEAVYANEEAVQRDVDEAVTAIKDAIEALVEVQEPVNTAREALQKLYNQYAALEQGKYTDASYQAFKDALKKAAEVLADADASDAELIQAYDALAEAINKLEVSKEPGTEETLRDQLQKLYDKYKNLAQGKYTNSSYDAFAKALKATAEVLANENATDEEMRAAYKALATAVNGLTVKSSSAAVSTTAQTTKTGDTAPVVLYVVIAMLALFTASGMLVIKRRRRK